MLKIAVINQKGGVGKTTSVANLGAALAKRGSRVCLLDLDPQSHLTLHYGVEPGGQDKSVYDVLTSSCDFASACRDVGENLRLVPAVIDLAAAEVELAATVGREQILRDALAVYAGNDDLLLIDCPPSLGLLTLNALAAVDEIIIPLQPHFLALQGLGKLLETVMLVQRRINPGLRVGGVVLCMYETGTRLAAEVVNDLRAFFESARGGASPWANAQIFQTVIRRNIKLAECPSHGKTIFQYDGGSNGAADYGALADEVLSLYRSRLTSTPEPAPHAKEAPERIAPVAPSPSPQSAPSPESHNTQPAAAEALPGETSPETAPAHPSAAPGQAPPAENQDREPRATAPGTPGPAAVPVSS